MQHHARSVYHLSEARLHDSPGHLQDPLLDGFYLEVGAGDTLRRGRHKHFARRREYAPGRREEYRARNVRTDILAQALYELVYRRYALEKFASIISSCHSLSIIRKPSGPRQRGSTVSRTCC